MISIEDKYLEKALQAIKETVVRFRKQPFDALYESDIQGFLYVSLLKAFEGMEIVLSDRINDANMLPNGTVTNPAKCEYPSGIRFDIAVITPESRNRRSLWNQDIFIAIELKFWQVDNSGGGFRGDLTKLKAYRDTLPHPMTFSGHSFVFVHPGCNWKKHITDFILHPSSEKLKRGISLHVVDLSDSGDKWLTAE